MYRIAGFLRDIKYYLSKKEAKEFYGVIFSMSALIYGGGLILTHLILFGANMKDKVHEYCNWEAERGFSKIYNFLETPARKTTCWLWVSKKREMPIVVDDKTKDFIDDLFREENYVSCNNGTTKKRK